MSKKSIKQPTELRNKLEYFLLVILLIFIIPISYSNNTSDITTPRLLYWGVSLLVISFLVYFKNKNAKIDLGFLKLWIFPVYLIFFIFTILSLSQAINPSEALHDLTKTFLTLYTLVIATFIFNQQLEFKNILVKTVIISSFIATSIGLYQYFKFIDSESEKAFFIALYQVKGLMAHKNQFAISLFLMLPFSIYGLLKFQSKWRYASFISLILLLISFAFIQTRSVWIALFVFAFISVFTFFIKTKALNNSWWQTISRKTMILSLVLLLSAIMGTFMLFQKSNAIGVFRYQLNSIVDFDSDNNKGRLQIWESTYQMTTDHFWLGVGAGNWKIAVIPYYSKKYGESYENWRRPHNDFLWILSEKGIFALISYLMLFILIVFYVIKTLFSEANSDNKLFSRLMLAGIGGYFVIAFFSFPIERVNHQIYLALMMSGIISIYYRSISDNKKTSLALLTLLKISLPFIFLLSSIYYAQSFYKSEIYLKKYTEERQRKTPNWNQLSAYADQAFSVLTTLDSKQTPIHIYKGVSKLKLKNIEGALSDFKEAYQYHPYSPAVINNLGYAFTQIGDYKKAISLFKESLDVFPKNEDVIINLANVYYLDKNYTEAYNTLLLCAPGSDNPKIPGLKKAIEKKLKTDY